MVSLSNRRVTFEISDAPAAHEKGGGPVVWESMYVTSRTTGEKKHQFIFLLFSFLHHRNNPDARSRSDWRAPQFKTHGRDTVEEAVWKRAEGTHEGHKPTA